MSAKPNAITAPVPRVRFVEDHFPLLVVIGPREWDEAAVQEMAAGYERYFERGERYALISGSPRESVIGAKERKLITDWSNSTRVRDRSRELCVGSATIVRSAISRGALTAMMWIWKPASPHLAAGTPEEALDYVFERLSAASIALPRPAANIRRAALDLLNSA